MKKLLLLCATLALASCSNYESSLAKFIETNEKGVRTDMDVKLIESKEVGYVTAADSLAYFKAQRESWKESRSESCELYILRYKEMVVEFGEHEDLLKTIKDYEDEYQSYQDDTFKYPYADNGIKKYSEIAGDKKLAKIVECRYSFKNVLANNAKQELTGKFVFSLNGKQCFGFYKFE